MMWRLIYTNFKHRRIAAAGMLISCSAIVVLLYIVITSRTAYDFWYTERTAFIPSLEARFDTPQSLQEMKALTTEIRQQFGPIPMRFGRLERLPDSSLTPDTGSDTGSGARTINRPIHLLGLALDEAPSLALEQNGLLRQCRITGIDCFGDWLINIADTPLLEAGPATLPHPTGPIPVSLTKRRGRLQIRFTETSPLINRRFYTLVYDTMDNACSISHSGITSDRFAIDTGLTDEENQFNVHKKKAILAYAAILFDDGAHEPIALASVPLFKDLNRYLVIISATLNHPHGSTPLLAMEPFHSERHRPHMLIVNARRMGAFFPENPGFNLLQLYGDGKSMKAVSAFFTERKIPASLREKSTCIPRLHAQRVAVGFGTIGLFLIAAVAIASSLWIRCVNFYTTHRADLAFIKINGGARPIFSFVSACAFCFAAVAGYVTLHLFLAHNNSLLERHFYPKINFDPGAFILVLATCAAIWLITLILESRLIQELSYSNIGRDV